VVIRSLPQLQTRRKRLRALCRNETDNADAGANWRKSFRRVFDRAAVSNNQEHVVAICNPGMFTGEFSVLSGRRGLVRIRAAEKSQLIEIECEALQALVETDSELSDIFPRAFILRRLELIAREVGDIVLIGSSHSFDTLRIKEFLTRNYQPYSYVNLERDAELQEILDHFSLSIDDLPVLICRGTAVLRNPNNAEITECLGFNEGIDQAHVRDLIKPNGNCYRKTDDVRPAESNISGEGNATLNRSRKRINVSIQDASVRGRSPATTVVMRARIKPEWITIANVATQNADE
jgi:hypothetical protein